MAKTNSWISHIEAFVDASCSSNQQNASVDAIAALVKNDSLTLEDLVREMELYLTTTDNIIRARGTLLLGEVLSHLTAKPLSSTIISSLVGFFTSRLADWQALRGTLVGCLALLRRKSNVGMVVGNEAKMLAENYLANVQTQSLAVHDRKLCFEVLQCLLDVYPEAVMDLDDELIRGILDAIDGEKDPRCLILTFHIAETLMRLFPDQSKSEESFAEEIFEILSCYFPIYFTHQKVDDLQIKRDDLSRELMNAFCSTPYFEPFAIPLVLDKLSSSLPLAKLDSLKYLSNCILHYGADRMFKHAKDIWFALKDVIFDFSPEGIIESAGDMESQKAQIAKEALTCLQMAVSQLNFVNSEPFTSLILDDPDIERIFLSVCLERSYSGIPKETLHQLNSIGSILSIASKVSIDGCSKVFQKFFPRLMNLLGVDKNDSSYGCIKDCNTSSNLNFGALYLCVEFLDSCRDLTIGLQDIPPQAPDSWCYLLKDFCGPLSYAFKSSLVNTVTAAKTGQEYVPCVVKGLQVLATFPGCHSPVSEKIYEDILAVLMSVITGRFDEPFLWRTALEALIQIGLHIEKFHDSKKERGYCKFVVERIVSMLLHDDTTSLGVKLEVISEIGTAGPDFMSTVIRGLEDVIFSNFSEIWVNGNLGAAEILVPLLQCYSNRVLPWCHKFGKADQVAMQFATNIWNLMEKSSVLSVEFQRNGVLDTTMMVMKLCVGYCTEENQSIIVRKAYTILSSTTFLLLDSLGLPLSNLEALQSIPDISGLSCKDEWLISLFASVVIVLHPQTPVPDVGALTRLFTVFLLKGHLPAAQALASMINKWPANIGTAELSSTHELEVVIDVVLESISAVLSSCLKECKIANGTDDNLSCSSLISYQIHAIVGLAWLGKSLLMRGHDKVKEIAKRLLKCLLSDQDIPATSVAKDEARDNDQNMHSLLIRAAADAFHILLTDSEVCLNRKFHATMRPLYKQRFFSSMMPVLLSSIKESNSSRTRAILYRALGHIFSDTPLAAVVAEAKKVIPALLEGLSISTLGVSNKEMTYNLLLVLSGILMDENGKEAIVENAHTIINHLIRLVSYPHMMLVRETAIQCLTAMSSLPHTRIYPMRPQVLRALVMSLDDPKRHVRQEAVRCRQAWASIASRSLHF
ncbi:uncharacterized protein A4U43_C05F26550 [Asparagus officinalis]|uniref:MMS19 nucleotide excision repair protein n=1 Tax=Asparagus officinalis TaxID=4686 RepID=A0A5P1EUV3_ASPOF|nr:MMS19 nucleotide excision repair protein homolog isoform X2 [Asparagus officinalis]ONK69772.1 uncharacterized protein A4U43_C05F26550 [Asparagus officinalis]